MADRKEVWCVCGHCSWAWAAYSPLPAPLEVVSKALMAVTCPHCPTAPKQVFLAREADIQRALTNQQQEVTDAPHGP